MEKCYQEKKDFVENELEAVVKVINKDIVKLEYIKKPEYELVEIKFSDDSSRKVAVSGDSIHALAYDLINRV